MNPLFSIVSFCIMLFCTINIVFAQEDTDSAEGDIISPGLHARLYDSTLKELVKRCAEKEHKDTCIDEFWEVADVSGDSELSVAEITRILRMVSGKSAYQAYLDEYEKWLFPLPGATVSSPPESREIVVVLGMAAVGPVLSHAIMGNFDYDDNGLLSKAEILHDLVEDLPLEEVDDLPTEIRTHASNAIGLLLRFLLKND